MRPQFPPPVKKILLQMPLYTPAILGTENGYAALILRVEKLKSFRGDYPIMVRLATWQSLGGTWIVAVAFRVYDNPKDPMEGDAYLNPRQADDWETLHMLTTQDRFPILFCNPKLTEAVGKATPWTDQEHKEVQQLCDTIDKTLAGKLSGLFDPDFQKAKDEFQRQYSVKDLLA